MIGWPMYRLIKNVNKRGRLPDMKPIRVTISASIVVAALIVVFFIPLPVTRIRQHGFVEVQPKAIGKVEVEVPGILTALHVVEGQSVRKGKLLAELRSVELENERDRMMAQIVIKESKVKFYDQSIDKEHDPEQKSRLREERAKAEAELLQARANYDHTMNDMEKLKLFAPRDGIVIGLPAIDEVGKLWDKQERTTFCSIGDKTKLRVVVPLSPADNALLEENYKNGTLHNTQATIRVQGRSSKLWAGKISQLPTSNAPDIPVQLSNKAGGPVAVKPTSDPNKLVPQSQVFLVGIDFEKPDDGIAINTQAQVKIHCEYRSCAWWIHRTIASTFDIGLLRW
jgi:putative peptide zinc metalloprotease protein